MVVGSLSATAKPLNVEEAVQKARAAFNSGKTRPLEWRRKQLQSLLRMYQEKRGAMIEALRQDLRRSKAEAVLLETEYLENDLKNTLHCLEEWAAPIRPPKTFVNIFDDVVIHNEPYGVALVIGAWNYPLQLLLLPMAGALAAGNAVIVKPSELAAACARFVADTLPLYLDSEAVVVVEGGPEETTELLKQKFDYIFYTGSTGVGRLVHAAANRHLTPVTLELGGKSPVYIDSNLDMEIVAKRVLWGKFINAGQTCIAPDYVLCTKDTQDKFISAARKVLRQWYGDEPQKSPDLCRIINSRHFGRLQSLLDSNRDKIVIGGASDADDRYIEPTVMANVRPADKVMDDEIFGPILPIVVVENAFEAIQFVNEREHPLVTYVFSKDAAIQALFEGQTRSGSLCCNDTIMFYGVDTLPFGGIGHSGMGAYHGKATFDTFSHKKSTLVKNFNALGEKLASGRYPPYTDGNLKFITSLMKKRHGPSFAYLPYIVCFALGATLSYGLFAWSKMNSEQ